MNNDFIGALGLYPIEEIITNTSNDIIYYTNTTSNALINYTNTTSNALINYTNTTSNNLINYTDTTSNNIINYINSLEDTTLPLTNLTINKETIAGYDYAWNEAILEPLNHLSTINQVHDNVLPQQLDASLYRYYYFDNNQLKEAKQKLTLTSYKNGTEPPNYITYISYYELYKKWFGYVNYNNAAPTTPTGGIQMVENDSTQIGVSNSTINISFLLNLPDENTVIWYGNISAMPIITAWYQGRRTFRILFGFTTEVVNGFDVPKRFITVQYASFNHTTNTEANYQYIDGLTYHLPQGMTFAEYHFYSFNINKNQFYLYIDGSLVFTSIEIGVPSFQYYPNPANFYFAITDLRLEDNNYNLNETNHNKFQFADLYYFKRYLNYNEIFSLAKYHLASMNNTLRVYGTIECDRIITNQIIDFDHTEKKFKKLTYEISQVSNLQNILDTKESVISLIPDRVVVTDPNTQFGKLIVSSLTSNHLETIKTLIQEYNPIIEFIKHTFQSDIEQFINQNPNIITLGVSGASALYTWFTGGFNAFNANNRIPRRYITQHQDAGGDLGIFYPFLTNDNDAKIYITQAFKDAHINNKQPTITGGATTITDNNLTANKVLISDANGKVATSNNIDLTKLGYLDDVVSPIGASLSALNTSISSLSTDKQDNLSTNTTSIITITNDVIDSLFKKSGNNIYYTGGAVGIGTSTITSGYIFELQGSTIMNNTNSVDDYALINPLLLSLTKRVVFDIDSNGNKICKELISNTTLNYSQTNIIQTGGVYKGYVFENSGTLHIYDNIIPTYPLDTISVSFSFWCYRPSNFFKGTIVNNYDYVSCQIFKLDQEKLNLLFSNRRKAYILFKVLKNVSGVLVYLIQVQYASNNNDYFQEGNPFSPHDWGWYTAVEYQVPDENFFRSVHFYSFNLTKTSATIFIDGVQVATNSFTLPNPSIEWRLEHFYFSRLTNPENPNENIYNQEYIFWNVYFNYNRLYSANEVASLYRYETDTISNTLKVNGIIRTNALTTDALYLNGKEFSLPSSYNQKSLYYQEQETGKITVQDKANSVISVSVDATEINSVKNIRNNTGNSGFWYYADNNIDTVAQIKSLAISDVSGLQTALDGKASTSHNHDTTYAPISHSHTIANITGLQTALDEKASTSHNHDTTYAPLSHSHTIANITGLQTALDGKASTSHNHDSTYAPISHSHSIANITGLQTALDGKEPTITTLGVSKGGTGANSLTANQLLIGNGTNAVLQSANLRYDSVNNRLGIGTNTEPAYTLDVYGNIRATGLTADKALTTDLNNQLISSATSATQLGYLSTTTSDVQTQLNGKASTNHNHDTTYAPISHSHTIANITGLQTALDGKASTNHNHDTTYAPISHSHTIANITGLQTALDGKEPTITTLGVSKGGTGANSLTANQLLVGNGTNNVLQSANLVWDNTNNRLGIGTDNPSYKLHVAGGTIFSDGININFYKGITFGSFAYYGMSAETGDQSLSALEGDIVIKSDSTNKVIIQSGNDVGAIIIPPSNNVGIGITNPSSKLHVVGNAYIDGGITITDLTADKALITDANKKLISSATTATQLGYLSTTTSDVQTQLNGKEPSINTLGVSKGGTGANSLTANQLLIGNGTNAVLQSANLRYDSVNNRLGIGTNTEPAYTLDVYGNIRATGLTADKALATDANNQLISSATTATQLGYLSTTTSDVQTQLNGKEPSINTLGVSKGGTGANTLTATQLLIGNGTNAVLQSVNLKWDNVNNRLAVGGSTNPAYTLDVSGNIRATGLTADRALATDTNDQLISSATTATQLGFLSTTTSDVQTQLNGKEPTITVLPVSKGGIGTSTIPASKLLYTTSLDTIGNLGIGTGLSIVNNDLTASAGSSSWSTAGNNYTTGNVGIGTNSASATYKLDIQGSAPKIRIFGTTAQDNATIALREDTDLYGFDVAYDGNTDNKFYLKSYNNSATGVVRLSIDRNTGVVGIGTTSALRFLHLHSTSTTGTAIFQQFTDTSATLIGTGLTSQRGCLIGKQTNHDLLLYNYTTGSAIIFGTAPTTTGTIATAMTIGSSGNVGIATAPHATYKLDVNGNVRVSGLTASRLVRTDANDQLISSTASPSDTELDYLVNVSSPIQTQLNGKQATLTAGTGISITGTTIALSDASWVSNTSGIYYNPAVIPVGNTAFVGIGTNTPAVRLHVVGKAFITSSGLGDPAVGSYGGNDGTKIILWSNGASSVPYAFGINSGKLWYGTPTSAYHAWFAGTTQTMTLNDGGGLSVSGGFFGMLRPDYNAWHKSGENRNRFYFSNNSTTYFGGVGYVWRKSDDTFDNMNLTDGGFLGLGISPYSRLHVASASINSGTQNFRYFNYTYQIQQGTTYLSDTCAVFDSSLWCKSWIASSSDVRIKKDIIDIDDNEALQKILLIEPKKYKYIDEVEKNTSNYVYGFIAQQIKEVLPDAVDIKTSIIPNIYQVCDYTSNGIYYENTSNISFSSNLNIDVISLDGKRDVYKVQDYSSNYIKLDKEIQNSSNVFVYGTEVQDFHTLNKDYLFTLNVCATQELYRIIQRQEERIQNLENIILNYSSNI